jgi:glycosyltransferase involved in cell wall biosynthesis
MTGDGRAPEVLFLGHEASRTGAPLMFLYFLRWLREHTDLAFEVVLVDGGPLVDDFAALARTTVLADVVGDEYLTRTLNLDEPFPGRAGRAHRKRLEAAVEHLRGVPLVYCNSITAPMALTLFGPPQPARKVVTHVHEMEAGFRVMGPRVAGIVTGLTDEYVAASDRVGRALVEQLHVDPAHVTRHYEFIDVDAMAGTPPTEEAVRAARESCGIPQGVPIVGSMGVTEWRKGPDLFLLLARLVDQRAPERDVHFVWVGAREVPTTEHLRTDIAGVGLADRVHLLGPEPNPARWFALYDVFTLTSREDPFPLVCLESSLLGTPIVCFDNTGMAEFAGDGDCGFVVEYLDVEAMADRVLALLDDPGLRQEVGGRAARRVRAEFGIDHGAPALYRDLERWRAGG